ncbi:hypothetical protein Gohar_003142, partial [Gossypium harknessii]|nr:hypothetical protein [Gossypium harknessii]
MEESSGVESLGGDEISLLAKELVQLSVKSSVVVPSEKPTLLWQNLFLIVFETEEDLEKVMEGRPWLFRKQLILFNWLVKLKPLHRRIFVSEGIQWKSWISFKYENLATFFFVCGRMGHGFKDCIELTPSGMFTVPKSRYDDGMFKYHNEGDIQEEGSVIENIERLNGIDSMLEDKSKSVKKTSWKRIRPGVMMNQDKDVSIMRKRKSAKIETDECSMMNSREDGYKRTKRENIDASRPDAMKIICWNVHGLGSPRAVHRLWYLLKQHNPQMVFFMETKIDEKRMEKVRRRCGFVNGIDLGAKVSRGGLCLAWKGEITIKLRSFSKSHIDVLIKEDNVA